MSISNYITISRKLFEHHLWCEGRIYSRFEAWLDLIQQARFEDTEQKQFINGKMVRWVRSELPVSLRFLATRWGWSKNKVDNFFILLENDKMIEKRTAKGTSQTIIRLCNYDSYNFNKSEKGQSPGQSRDSEGTVKGQARDKTNKVNKENIDNTETTDFIDKIVDCFSQTYFDNFNLTYEITNKGRERGCAGKIAKLYKKKYPCATSDEAIQGLKVYFDSCCKINDKWLSNNMSLSTIISKFNEINNFLKNGSKQRKNGNGATDAELADVFAKHFATDYK